MRWRARIRSSTGSARFTRRTACPSSPCRSSRAARAAFTACSCADSEDLQEGEAQDDARLAAVPARDGRARVEANERRPRTGHLPGEARAAEVGPVESGG